MTEPNEINSQLSKLKDLDVADLVKILGEHKNAVVMFALIAGSLLIMFLMFNDHSSKEQFLRTQTLQGQDKIEFIKKRDEAKQKLNDFKSSVPPKIDEHGFIALISDYAKENHITINTLSPGETNKTDLYDIINISFKGESEDYRNMMLFLRKIEKSKSPLRIDSWSGYLDVGGKVVFSIDISAVLLNI